MKKMILLSLLIISCQSVGVDGWWGVSIDASVGCEGLQPIREDVDFYYTTSNEMHLFTNVLGKEGLFVNGILGKQFPLVTSVYTVSGEFRIPEEAQNEHISINIQWVDNYTERYSELFWTVNPHSPLYEWVWTRNVLDEQIKLFQIPFDNNWHSFKLISDHVNHVTMFIQVDEQFTDLQISMGTVEKAWEESFTLLLETHNQYPNCGSDLVTIGKSEWRNIELSNGN